MNLSILFLFSITLVAVAGSASCNPGYYKLNSGACLKCPKGTFQPRSNKYACRPCPPGKIAKEEGSTICTPCLKNSEPSEFRNKCVCSPGSVKNGRKCEPCTPGTFFQSRRNYRSCSSCDPGYFQSEAGQFECLKCPDGSFSGYGARECVTCAEDEEFSRSDDKCVRCKAGHSFRTYSGCVKCEANTYKPKAGNDACLPCPLHTHSKPGAKYCVPCPKGTVLLRSGKCGACPAGFHLAEYKRKCVKCRAHQFTPYENVLTSCFSCSGKKFALKGSSKCISCPKHKYLLKNGKCEKCPQGSVYDRYRLSCRKCRVNQFNRGDMRSCESCQEGSYSLPGSTTCFLCPEDTALILAKKNCGSCAAGSYYDRYDAKCQKCYDGSIQPEAGIERDCKSCPDGTNPNKARTKCIPVH